MQMTKNAKLAVITVGIFIATILGIFLILKVSIYLAPFIIAFAISTSIEPIVRTLMKRTKMSRKASATITVLSVVTVAIAILILLTIRLYKEAASLSEILPKYLDDIYENLNNLNEKFLSFYTALPKELTISMENIFKNFTDILTTFLNSLIRGILNVAALVPQAFIFLFATILSTYFLSSDRTKIFNFVKKNLPRDWMDILLRIKKDIFITLWGYIRAQIILVMVTFFQLSVGFVIIGIKHSVLLAFIMSLLDIFPIVGPGSVMIPWAIYEFFIGNLKRSVMVLILYGTILTVRQLIEPKILSSQIGLHPLVALMSLYIGFLVFGYLGLIIGPITVLLFKNIFSSVILKKRSLREFIAQTKL
ncbi:sporulation integral membrane protein YtvI [Herbivorax sp. ANBcel31]|uniref:sporulation integral membrane protein YtvI n=1 Tax=Herbivorax sp. ANBcel31 TaxID=3069754 RepID=UPI0027B7915B|nr:sporulation integral membrane protein YtvI [Herbivorax sp. ANBcel31]MDQ2087718.1 sporulation integral membrane protein YtvI [Herbivorax sp. ANBcel31]